MGEQVISAESFAAAVWWATQAQNAPLGGIDAVVAAAFSADLAGRIEAMPYTDTGRGPRKTLEVNLSPRGVLADALTSVGLPTRLPDHPLPTSGMMIIVPGSVVARMSMVGEWQGVFPEITAEVPASRQVELGIDLL